MTATRVTSGGYDRTAELGAGGRMQLHQLLGRRAPPRLEAGRVPAGETRPSLVGRLEKRKQRFSWPPRPANGFVGEDGEGAAPRGNPLAERQRLGAEAVRLGRGVGVEVGVRDVVVPRPEAEGDDLVRVRLLLDGVVLDRDAGLPREARDGEVEAVPEEMDGARLAVEPATELDEDGVSPVEDKAEA